MHRKVEPWFTCVSWVFEQIIERYRRVGKYIKKRTKLIPEPFDRIATGGILAASNMLTGCLKKIGTK